MTIAVKVVLNPNTTNQPTIPQVHSSTLTFSAFEKKFFWLAKIYELAIKKLLHIELLLNIKKKSSKQDFIPLPDDKILDWSESKQITDDI